MRPITPAMSSVLSKLCSTWNSATVGRRQLPHRASPTGAAGFGASVEISCMVHDQAAGIGALSVAAFGTRTECFHPAVLGVGQLKHGPATVHGVGAGRVAAIRGDAIEITLAVHQHASGRDARVAIRAVEAVGGYPAGSSNYCHCG